MKRLQPDGPCVSGFQEMLMLSAPLSVAAAFKSAHIVLVVILNILLNKRK